jgi:hypothetical protein
MANGAPIVQGRGSFASVCGDPLPDKQAGSVAIRLLSMDVVSSPRAQIFYRNGP